MSKIIKSYEQQNVAAFDFDLLEKTDSPSEYRDRDRSENEAEEAPTDPMAELEQAIHKRMLEAERKAQEIEREAYEKGYAQGEKDGMEYGRKSMQIIKERMEYLVGSLEALPERAFKDYRDWFLNTCLTITRKLVRRELTAQPETLIQLIDSLLEEAEASQNVVLYLNPNDLDMMKKHMGLSPGERAERMFTLKPDSKLERGGCKLETAIQLLDASIESRFAILEEAMSYHGPED